MLTFMKEYDLLKMLENASKRLIQEELEITVLNPRQYRKRFQHAMSKYFTILPTRVLKHRVELNNTG